MAHADYCSDYFGPVGTTRYQACEQVVGGGVGCQSSNNPLAATRSCRSPKATEASDDEHHGEILAVAWGILY